MHWMLFSILIAGTKSRSKDLYHVYSLQDICPLGHRKREINLSTGAAIFILNEEANDGARTFLSRNDLSCHLELEAPVGFGFHVFMEDLSLDEDPDDIDHGRCQDYVQFGRDFMYFTTSKSQKFCGKRIPIFYQNNPEGQQVKIRGQGLRWHIEEIDNEMDFWIMVKKNQRSDRANKKSWRRIKLVVTVFKKNCGFSDLTYRQCQHTNRCIKKDYFCDTHANCAWPTGYEATDEKNCDSYYQGAHLNDGAAVLVASNIPVIIIAAIGVCLSVTFIIFFVKRFIFVFCDTDDISERASAAEDPDPRSIATTLHTLPSNNEQISTPPLDEHMWPPPPSYDDVIKAGIEGRICTTHDSQPPPYSPPSPPLS